jgi:phosphoribosylamine--glycine ligase
VHTGHASIFTDYESAMAFVHEHLPPMVIKADGLASGKGVIIAHTIEETEAALRECFIERRFGAAAQTVLVEEFLSGEEVSLLSLVSGEHVLPLAPAQDYKRALDGDEGPNTGGMGSYSPVPVVDDELYAQLVKTVVRPTVAELRRRGIDYRGVLYAGLMLTPEGPMVLEFNCRFGDPETQALLPRLRSDLFELLWAAAHGEPLPETVEWTPGATVGVVLASEGYPARSSKGDVISGLENARALDGVQVFHAATKRVKHDVVTDGGRVLTATGSGATFGEARARAYEAVAAISFRGQQHRSDIALRAEKWGAQHKDGKDA